MHGLIIKEIPLKRIIRGVKTLEIRGSNTHRTGETIYLIESGTHKIRGTCKIKETIPITKEYWENNRKFHCVNRTYEEICYIYATPYAWVLEDVQEMDKSYYFHYPRGVVIWVKNVTLNEVAV